MKNPLKPIFDFLTITGGEALVLFLFTGLGVAGIAWGSSSMTASDWLNWKTILCNIPLLAGAGTLALTFLVYIGCMHDSEKRGLVLCAVFSILLHVGLFSWFACLIIGNHPTYEEQEVALNLNSKPPVIVNDYYFTEMPGDEVVDGNADENADSVPRFSSVPQIDDAVAPPVPETEELNTDLERTAQAHEELEEQVEETAESSSEARSKASEMQLSELAEIPPEMTPEESNQPPQSFMDRQNFGQNLTAGGIIGAEEPSPTPGTAPTEITTAESVQRKRIDLREEARKRQEKKSGFRQKLDDNQPAPVKVKTTEKGTLPSTVQRNGENLQPGAAQNWGETTLEAARGGAGKTEGEIRSGLGEEQSPAASAAGLQVKTPETKSKRKKVAVTDDVPASAGGQTLGARAGDDENLDAVLTGAINGVSDAVLETTAKPEKVSGSNVLETERKEILENVVIFRFENPTVPEMGFQPDLVQTEQNREQVLEEIRQLQNEGEDEDSDGDLAPEMNLTTGENLLLKPGEAIKPEPSLPYRQRMRQNHRQMIEEAGGNPLSEQVVELGLQFLDRNQYSDGHWSLNFLPTELPEGMSQEELAMGTIHADTAATGLSLLAFLGAGYTHLGVSAEESDGSASVERKEYAETINRGLLWLMQNQQPDGSLFRTSTDSNRYSRIYSHGIATIALCEAYGMTHDSRLREPAQRAVDFILKAQTPLGGWRYTPEKNDGVWRGEADTSVSGWQAMALVSAKMAGLNVPKVAFQNLEKWVKTASIDGGKRFCYLPVEKVVNDDMENWKKPSYAMTAEGLLMELYLNYDPQKPEFQDAANYLMTNLPTVTQTRRDTYYWYYATQVMFHLHDARWKEWQANLVQSLQQSQEKENEYLRGSWNPMRPAPDQWGLCAGRLYVTTMHLLMLEVYYRYLPLFRELNPKGVDAEKSSEME